MSSSFWAAALIAVCNEFLAAGESMLQLWAAALRGSREKAGVSIPLKMEKDKFFCEVSNFSHISLLNLLKV